MLNPQEAQSKIESLNNRIAKLRVTIKSLNDDISSKDLIIKEKTQELEELKKKTLGMSLNYDRLSEDLARARKGQKLQVCDISHIKSYIDEVTAKVEHLEQSIINQDINYQQTDIANLMRQLNQQVELNNEIRDQLLQERIASEDAYRSVAQLEAQIRDRDNIIIEQKQKINELYSMEGDVKLAEKYLDDKDVEISELKERLESMTKKHSTKLKLLILTTTSTIVLSAITAITLFVRTI